MSGMVAALMQINGLFCLIARAQNKLKQRLAKLKQMWPKNTILNIDVFIMLETAWATCRGNKSKNVAFSRVSLQSSLSLWHHVFWIRCARKSLKCKIKHWRMSFDKFFFFTSRRPYGKCCLFLSFPLTLSISLNRIKSKIEKYMRAHSNVTCFIPRRCLFFPSWISEITGIHFSYVAALMFLTHKAQSNNFATETIDTL